MATQSATHHHGPGCGHMAIHHEGHVDYLDDGHLQHDEDGRIEDHRISVTDQNPDACRPLQSTHTHGPNCGHETVPHGDHVDYLVDGHLEHPHGDHNDDHGPLKTA